jgi:hypothetical protein
MSAPAIGNLFRCVNTSVPRDITVEAFTEICLLEEFPVTLSTSEILIGRSLTADTSDSTF